MTKLRLNDLGSRYFQNTQKYSKILFLPYEESQIVFFKNKIDFINLQQNIQLALQILGNLRIKYYNFLTITLIW